MRSATVWRVVGCGVAALGASSCSESWGNDNSAPVDISVTADGTSKLTLYVTNQSYVDSNVDIDVVLDGDVIIARGFNVGDQHNHIEHRVQLDAGSHRLDATTVIDGETIEVSEELVIEANQQRYAVLSYWHYVPTRAGDTSFDPPQLNLEIQDEPIGFD